MAEPEPRMPALEADSTREERAAAAARAAHFEAFAAWSQREEQRTARIAELKAKLPKEPTRERLPKRRTASSAITTSSARPARRPRGTFATERGRSSPPRPSETQPAARMPR
jgi:hypothetical protein